MDEGMDKTTVESEDYPKKSGLMLRKGILTAEKITEWFSLPFFPETKGEITVPLAINGAPFLFCTNGFLIRLPMDIEEGFLHKGKTAPFNSNLSIVKTGEGYHLKGILRGETADYTINYRGAVIEVAGDTGKFRARYSIVIKDNELSLDGDTGEFSSRLTFTRTGEGFAITGFTEGDKTEMTISESEGKYHHEGLLSGSHYDLFIEETEGSIHVEGEQKNQHTSFTIEKAQDGFAIEGMIKSTKVHMTITATDASSYKIAGGAEQNIVDYTITRI